MSIKANINDQIKDAMRSKDETRLAVLRQLKTALMNASSVSGNISDGISFDAELSVVRKQIAQRQDSITQWYKAGRHDMANIEQAEINVLKEYLPKELTSDQINDIVTQAINETGALSKKDMGRVMKKASELAKGAVDNKTLSSKINEKLN